jgi:two-component system, NtrC family, nitrogen regulation sensor histidine kinase NtrY
MFKFISNKFGVAEETRYYLRDFLIFSFTLFISIAFAELFFFESGEEVGLSGRVDTYFLILVPFFMLSLILSYVYRNRRNRETGKIRSSIRYRLTLAFLFVALLPSLPILVLSSNMSVKLIEGFYRVDIASALRSSVQLISEMEEEERTELGNLSEKFFQAVKGHLDNPNYILTKIDSIGISAKSGFLLGIWNLNVPVFFSVPFPFSLEELIFKENDGNLYATFYDSNQNYLFLKKQITPDIYFILGKRIHLGMEGQINEIQSVTSNYQSISLWKEKIPNSIRYTIGFLSLLMFAIAISFSFLFARRISGPIINLANATKDVSLGRSDVKIEKTEEGEMGILIDSFNQMVSDLKSKNEELMHTQRIAAWKEVAQRMAHEIKNPLTPIQLSAERMRRKLESGSSPEQFSTIVKDSTETIIGQVRVLEHLVKEFSEFARMPVPVLINQSINPILEESANLFKESTDILFDLKLGLSLPELFLDKRLFMGVVNNLIKNAVEAIHQPDPSLEENTKKPKPKTIRITSKIVRKALRRSVIIEIEDSGPGLPENLREKIFEPYFSTKENHGSGIGLAVVQKTVIDHHGHISVESSKLGGCKFKIEIPVEQ